MIQRQTILDSINKCEQELKILTKKHSNLHQIDMLSGEGSTLRENIAQTEGYIKALQWILKMI